MNITKFCNVNYYTIFCLIFANFFRLNKFIYKYQNYYKNKNFEQFYVTKRFIIFNTNNFTLQFLIFKIDFFCLNVDIFITIIDDINCFVIFFQNFYIRFFAILFELLFNIDYKFNKKIINIKFFETLKILNIFKFSKHSNYFFKTKIVI